MGFISRSERVLPLSNCLMSLTRLLRIFPEEANKLEMRVSLEIFLIMNEKFGEKQSIYCGIESPIKIQLSKYQTGHLNKK